MKNIILASTSTVYGGQYLEYLLPTLEKFFKRVDEVLFIPFARPGGISYDDYTQKAVTAFSKIGKSVIGIHTTSNYKEAIKNAKAIFTGGGNTFELLRQLYQNELLEQLSFSVANGALYLGTSAGSNICGQTINNTNDMPIVYPPSFNALGLVPFNINPHYLDPIEGSTHMGETRETRIKEFFVYNDIPVVGLREGSWLEISGKTVILCGTHTARIFEKDKQPKEIKGRIEF